MSNTKAFSARDTLCQKKWDHPTIDIQDGTVRMCCRSSRQVIQDKDIERRGTDSILNNTYLLNRRAEMFQGIQHSDCNSCWETEKLNAPSPRDGVPYLEKRFSKIHGYELPDKTNLSQSDPVLRADDPKLIEIQLGIVCDLKCIYCYRGNSSSWLNEDFRFNEISKDEYQSMLNRERPEFSNIFWSWLEKVAATAKMISFVGGEPTLAPNFIFSLNKVAQILNDQKSNASVRIVTNLNASDHVMNQFLNSMIEIEKKRTVRIDISMESVGKQAEFIRSGLKWSRFLQNLEKILKETARYKNIHIAFSSTINALSFGTLSELHQLLMDYKIEFNKPIRFIENSVIEPSWLAPRILSDDFYWKMMTASEKLRELEKRSPDPVTYDDWSFNWTSYSYFISDLAAEMLAPLSDRSRLQAQFYKNIKKLELKRGLDFLTIFPEYADFLKLAESQFYRFELDKTNLLSL